MTGSIGVAREIATNVNRGHMIDEGELGPNALVARGVPRNSRDNKKTKSTRFCSHCQRSGHTMDQCFKLIGYLDLFEGLKDSQRAKRPLKMVTNVQGSSVDFASSASTPLEDTGIIRDNDNGN